MIAENRVKRLLKEGKVALGAAVSIGHTDVAEIMANMGFDWLVFDTEHSPLTVETVQELMQAAKGTDTTMIVRVAWNDLVLVKLALDIGAHGLIIPWVNNRDQARAAVAACKYPPKGVRGYGPRRAAYAVKTAPGYTLKGTDYMEWADREILLIPQVETAEAVRNVGEILSVEGIDAFIVGPADLSTSLGIPLQFDHPMFKEAVDRILEAGRAAHVPAGFFAWSAEAARELVAKGFQLICVGNDVSFLAAGALRALNTVRGEAG